MLQRITFSGDDSNYHPYKKDHKRSNERNLSRVENCDGLTKHKNKFKSTHILLKSELLRSVQYFSPKVCLGVLNKTIQSPLQSVPHTDESAVFT